VPGDKSISHRALLFLALSDEGGRIRGLLESEDCLATLKALRAMGVDIERLGDGEYRVGGCPPGGLQPPQAPLDMGNAGTGMRLLAGVLAGAGIPAVLTGDASLRRRPMGRIVDPLRQMGAALSDTDGCPPLTLEAHQGLEGIDYALPVASAQVKSAILLAGLSARGTTRIHEPGPSRDHTERMLAGMGISIEKQGRTLSLTPPATESQARPKGQDIVVPGDLSSAAFFLAAAAARPGAAVVLKGVGVNPSRDGIIHLLRRMGAELTLDNPRQVSGEPVADIAVRGRRLTAIRVEGDDVALAVDEIPALLMAAAQAEGRTEVHGAAELRVKESDRIEAMAAGLSAMGVVVESWADGMAVNGGPLQSATVQSFGDHRIAMSLALLGHALEGEASLQVEDVDNVATSFPGFTACCQALGLTVECFDE